MFTRAEVTCPNCKRSRCRESKWLSRVEKRGHPDSRPYRCLDCSHRFISHKGTRFDNFTRVSALAAILAIALVAAISALIFRSAPPPPQHPPAKSTAIDPADLKAAQGGDAGAQLRVGEALLHVAVREKENSVQAVRWLRSSAENGNTAAMLQLGKLYRSGVGVLQNFDQSAKWIQTAAARGNAEGMLELGRLYRDGIGFEKSPVRAYVWFNRAAAVHNLDAVREREDIARSLNAEELKKAQNQSSEPETGSGAGN